MSMRLEACLPDWSSLRPVGAAVMAELFAVHLFFLFCSYHCEGAFLEAEAAATLAVECSRRPAAVAGFIRRIIITDGGDDTVFEWRYGEGVTFPPPPAGDDAGS
jgi:hypothetical protein